MKLHPITTKQFTAWSVLITLAFATLVINQGGFPVLFNFPLLIATFVIMPSEVRRQPVTRGQLLLVLGGVAAMAAFIAWCIKHPTPMSDASPHSFTDSFSHPVVAVPLWLFVLYLGYRRWRAKPPLKEAEPPPHDHEHPQSS